jgi:putative ABC transport system ATP-binding protein
MEEQPMSQAILLTQKLCKTFSRAGTQQHVLKNLDMDIREGDFTVIMGASGAGKSTLLYALSGMDKPTLGQIFFKGREISKLSNDQLAVFRRSTCGFVFQQVYLMDSMSVLDNVLACGLLTGGRRKAVFERAKVLFAQVGLSEADYLKFPSQLSGGEAQRAGLVRALINSPQVVFADEPTGALNSAAGKAVLDTLTQVHKNGQSIILVTHDLRSARRGNRIIYLRDGIICGECDLGGYVSGDNARHNKLNAFLREMGW